jgi:hypothetical protein
MLIVTRKVLSAGCVMVLRTVAEFVFRFCVVLFSIAWRHFPNFSRPFFAAAAAVDQMAGRSPGNLE